MTHDQTTTIRPPAMKEVSIAIGSVAADLQLAVTRKFDETVTEVKSQAHDARDSMVGEVSDVAEALWRASEEMRSGSAQERILGQIAKSISDASDALRDKNMREMFQAASKIARDNPALYLGGAALLGFVASRYAKASGGAARARDVAEQIEQSDAFMSEGNPNTQPVETAP